MIVSSTILVPAASGDNAQAPAKARRGKFGWPRIALLIAPVLLAVSTLFAFWSLTLHAPQYPGGLKVTIFTHKVTGDVSEVDGLNHYIGMMPLGNAASLERSIATYAIVAFVLMGFLAALLKPAKAAFLATPIILFPFVFAADLYIWLYRAGHELDPTAALSSSIKEFTPAILGEGVVGQFSTTAFFGAGFFVALLAAVLALAGIIGRMRERVPESA
jgi:hypothetical protein